MTTFLRSLAFADALQSFGLWLVIGGSIAEALTIVFVRSVSIENHCQWWRRIIIALGVWVEKIGDECCRSPQNIVRTARW